MKKYVMYNVERQEICSTPLSYNDVDRMIKTISKIRAEDNKECNELEIREI